MAKRRRKSPVRPSAPPPPPPPTRPSFDAITLITLAGLVGAVALAFASWQKIETIEQSLESRLGMIELELSRVINDAPAVQARPAQPQRRGPDPDRIYDIGTVGAPVRGSATAPITIAEFSDFQCPFCARALPTLEQIADTYQDQVKIVWKHLPLEMHPQAKGAHLASIAAQRQGKFWEFHDRVFANQRELNNDTYRQYARELGLDMERFELDLSDLGNQRLMDADVAEAESMQITGTPGFFINGRFLRGAKPFETFARMINEELESLGLPIPEEAQGL
jgi:protein-disulfide isomerase